MEEASELGRPTKYKEEFNKKAFKLCLLGATDKELADFFETCEATINNWKIAHPSFLESLNKGKIEADAKVAQKLYQKAIGYEHKDVDIKMYEGTIIKTDLIKHYPPDTTAGIFWLKNRQSGKWRDKQDIEIKGTVKSIVEGQDPPEGE